MCKAWWVIGVLAGVVSLQAVEPSARSSTRKPQPTLVLPGVRLGEDWRVHARRVKGRPNLAAALRVMQRDFARIGAMGLASSRSLDPGVAERTNQDILASLDRVMRAMTATEHESE